MFTACISTMVWGEDGGRDTGEVHAAREEPPAVTSQSLLPRVTLTRKGPDLPIACLKHAAE